ncbi:MAG: murein biosynthesis integral membrane protein MurJ [Kiloniellales bacterium]
MALFRYATTVGGYTMASRVLGFVRDILIAALIGAGPVADAFFVAFRFPNMFRRLVAEGAFTAAFVPLFTAELEKTGETSARTFAEQTLAVLLSTLLAVLVLAEVAMPWLMYAIAPGFADEPFKFDLAIQFSRVTFPYLLFMALVALLGSVLNALYRFAAAAAAPILLNVFMIAALVVFAERTATPGHALAWAVAAAGAGQFLWLVFACHRAGMRLKLPRPRLTPGIRRLLALMVPGAAAAGVYQINLLISTVIASLLPTGAVSYLYYADRVNQLPLGVVGVAVGVALLPLVSRQLRASQAEAAMDSQNRALEVSLLLTLPAAAALLTIPLPIVTVLFERAEFGPSDSLATAMALAAFASGLPAYVLVKVLSPGFFAREDMVTPLKIAAVSVATNTALSLLLIGPLAHVGIALATALAGWLNAGLLAVILSRRGFLEFDRRFKRRLPRMVLSSAGMGALLWLGAMGLAGPLEGPLGLRVAALAALVAGGLMLFALLAQLTGAARLGDLKLALRRPRTGAA